jgi:hypothetical protein
MHDRRGHDRVPVATPLLLLLAVGFVAACGTTPATPPLDSTTAPSIGPATAVPTVAPATAAPATVVPATPVPTVPVSATPACEPSDLKASHGLIEGAAGSRLTEVLIVAAIACSIDAYPTLGLRDAAGDALVGGVPAGTGRIDLSPEASYTSAVRLANWCNDEPAFPLQLTLRLGGEELPVTGGSFPDEESGMPPCNGESAAPVLEGGAWTPGG